MFESKQSRFIKKTTADLGTDCVNEGRKSCVSYVETVVAIYTIDFTENILCLWWLDLQLQLVFIMMVRDMIYNFNWKWYIMSKLEDKVNEILGVDTLF